MRRCGNGSWPQAPTCDTTDCPAARDRTHHADSRRRREADRAPARRHRAARHGPQQRPTHPDQPVAGATGRAAGLQGPAARKRVRSVADTTTSSDSRQSWCEPHRKAAGNSRSTRHRATKFGTFPFHAVCSQRSPDTLTSRSQRRRTRGRTHRLHQRVAQLRRRLPTPRSGTGDATLTPGLLCLLGG